jgi:hypothetical protein
MMQDALKEFADKFRDRFTPEYIKNLAADGNHCLSKIERYEQFVGTRLLLPHPTDDTRSVLIERAQDYERVQWSASKSTSDVFALCNGAIRRLGARLERCLALETHEARGLALGQETGKGVDPISRWEVPMSGVVLYSLGPAPRLLEPDDGIQIVRIRPRHGGNVVLSGDEYIARGGKDGGGAERLLEFEKQYGDRLYIDPDAYVWCVDDGEPMFEARFGYYANTGPKDRKVQPIQPKSAL